MTGKIIPFNPLDKQNLGASVAEAMLARPAVPLADLPAFEGAGIYAIYYVGTAPLYKRLADLNKDGRFAAPIYVGKAVPSGARKGGKLASTEKSRALYARLKEHAESIRAVSNLAIEDFYCRFLAVDDIWIPLGESLLITKFSPIWNALVDGFGNHDPGSGRYNGKRPRWDVLHPGRGWAARCKEPPVTAAEIAGEVTTFLRDAVFPEDQRLISPNQGQPELPLR